MIKFSVIAPNATYDLVRNVTGVNEGSSFNITLNTTGVQNGQSIPYTITGIQQADINEPLTGSFVVHNGQANKTFNVVADVLTEGVEVFTMALDGVGSNVSVTINDTSTAGDPYWSNVVLLTHFDTTPVQELALGETISHMGSELTTAQYKFGPRSLSTSAGYAVVPPNVIRALGSSNFTIEAWVRPSPVGGDRMVIYGCDSSPSYKLSVDSSNRLQFFGDKYHVSSTVIQPNVWTHVAVSRYNNTIMLFANGLLVYTGAMLYNANFSAYDKMHVGADNSFSGRFWGNIDELRVTKGVARYTGTFTPPATAFLNF